MTRTLLACLLALAVSVQVRAHGGHPGQAAADKSKSLLAENDNSLPEGNGQFAQDTAKFGQLRGAQVTIAGTHARFGPLLPARPEAAQPANSPADFVDNAGEFDPETANLPAALAITLRRPAAPQGRRSYRTRLVRTGRFATRREAVEILTCTYAGPLVLAQLPATAATPAQLVAGPGYDQSVALRPLELTQDAVLKLCGDRASQVRAYAMLYNLHFQQADEVARMLDYYNRIAVAVKE